jgi:hypothetical protein
MKVEKLTKRIANYYVKKIIDEKVENKKHDTPTMAIRNAGESASMKLITLNKLFGRRTVKCFEICSCSYSLPL